MNILTDSFSNLFSLLWRVAVWIANFFKGLFQGLVNIIVNFFKAIYALIDGLLYFLYMIGVLAAKLFQVIWEAMKLLWALCVGFVHTLGSLSYSPQSSGGNGYSDMFGKLFNALSPLQINVLAYILLFMLWFVTAIAALKLLSSIRVGGD